MKYCTRLLNEINFEPSSLSPCCNTQNINIPASPYGGGAIDLKEYAKHIAATIDQLQADGEVCKGCRELEEIDSWPAASGKFSVISINMHRYYCNCKCVYCNLWNKKNKGNLYEVLPGLKSLKEQGAMKENAHISWGGGEPTILPEFDKAAKWLYENGCIQRIHSNGIKFSQTIADFLANDRGKINISLDSGSREVYKNVKGVDKFSDVVNTIEKYAIAGAKNIELKYIIFDKNNNITEIRRFIEMTARAGINDVQMSFDFRDQNADRISQKSLMAAAFLTVLAVSSGIKVTPFYMSNRVIGEINKYIEVLT